MSGTMTISLKVWRQRDSDSEGRFVDYVLSDVSPDMSFLEMLDKLAFDSSGNLYVSNGMAAGNTMMEAQRG